MINVKELRVGNHVLVDGERKWVKSASYPWIFLDDDVPCHEDHLEPIPLTAELLTEIGFEHIDKTPYVKHFDDSYIGLSLVGNGLWRVLEYDNVVCHGSMLCRYLHEAENFVYMALHKELIEE